MVDVVAGEVVYAPAALRLVPAPVRVRLTIRRVPRHTERAAYHRHIADGALVDELSGLEVHRVVPEFVRLGDERVVGLGRGDEPDGLVASERERLLAQDRPHAPRLGDDDADLRVRRAPRADDGDVELLRRQHLGEGRVPRAHIELVAETVGRLFRDIAYGHQFRALDRLARRPVRPCDAARADNSDSVRVSCHAVALPPMADHEGWSVGRLRAMAL